MSRHGNGSQHQIIPDLLAKIALFSVGKLLTELLQAVHLCLLGFLFKPGEDKLVAILEFT